VKHDGILVVYADEIVDGVGCADDASRIFVDGGAAGDRDREEVDEESLAGGDGQDGRRDGCTGCEC
jgi:hypothetical protein